MKKILLTSLVTLANWAGFALGQPMLGTPIASQPACESCTKPAVFAPPCADGRADCKTKLCQSSVVRLGQQMLMPVRLATGNLLPTCCVETICRDDVERMIAAGSYSPAEMAAVKIKLDEAQSKARRAAVRYLAGVNCHYYPEAEAGLIAALRADRNECVRLEAALALGTCNCLTPRIAEALSVTVSGGETDGNPGEISERVRSAARIALARCQMRGIGCAPQMLPPPDWSPPVPTSPTPTPTPEPPPSPRLTPPQSPFTIQAASAWSTHLPSVATPEERTRAESVSAAAKSNTYATGQRTLFHLIRSVMTGRDHPTQAEAPPRQPPAIRPLGLPPLGSEVHLAIPSGDNYAPPMNRE